MKKYNITVNGKTYDVAVEEANGSQPSAPAAPVAAPAAKPAAPAPAANVSGTEVKSPMPGTVLDVKVNVGDTIEKGSPVIVLEAMKMENDVVASESGKIASINVKKGDSLESGSLIAVIQ